MLKAVMNICDLGRRNGITKDNIKWKSSWICRNCDSITNIKVLPFIHTFDICCSKYGFYKGVKLIAYTGTWKR